MDLARDIFGIAFLIAFPLALGLTTMDLARKKNRDPRKWLAIGTFFRVLRLSRSS